MHEGNQIWFHSASAVAGAANVYCFAPAGSGASFFAGWHSKMPDEISIRAIQLPGREKRFREEPYRELPLLIDRLEAVFLKEIDQPFILFGHSMGAVIATLLAQKIDRGPAARNLKGLMASGIRPPHLPREHAPIAHLDDDAFLHSLNDRYGAIPAALLKNVDLRNMYLPALRADFAMLETRPDISPFSLDCPLIAFGGSQDTPQSEHIHEWSSYTNSLFRKHLIDGDHFFPRSNAETFLPIFVREACELLAF
jgi:surfactin synthase thioesterase subunit